MKRSRLELQAERDALSLENGLYLRYFHDVENGVQPAAETKQQMREDEWVSGKLYRAGSPDGGIVVIRYHLENGGVSAHIYSLETINIQMRDDDSQHTLPLRIVLNRLTTERNRAWASRLPDEL